MIDLVFLHYWAPLNPKQELSLFVVILSVISSSVQLGLCLLYILASSTNFRFCKGCLPFGWSGLGSVIQDHLDHGGSKKPLHLWAEWIHWFFFMFHDLSYLGPLFQIQILLKECTRWQARVRFSRTGFHRRWRAWKKCCPIDPDN